MEVESAGLAAEGAVGGERWEGIKETPSLWPEGLGHSRALTEIRKTGGHVWREETTTVCVTCVRWELPIKRLCGPGQPLLEQPGNLGEEAGLEQLAEGCPVRMALNLPDWHSKESGGWRGEVAHDSRLSLSGELVLQS